MRNHHYGCYQNMSVDLRIFQVNNLFSQFLFMSKLVLFFNYDKFGIY